MYEIYIASQAEKDLKRLDAFNFREIVTQVNKLGSNPRPPGCRKISGSRKDWRIRVGSYRIIYEIDDRIRSITVMRVRHRKEVYR
jgi:mRNA interferase RelE/StbE